MPRLSPLWALQEAIYDRLVATTAVMTLATGGIFNGRAPTGTTGCYVQIAPDGEDDADYFAQAGHENGIRLDLWEVSPEGLDVNDYTAVSKLYEAIKAVLDPHDPTVAPLVLPGQAANPISRMTLVTAFPEDVAGLPTTMHLVARVEVTSTNVLA